MTLFAPLGSFGRLSLFLGSPTLPTKGSQRQEGCCVVDGGLSLFGLFIWNLLVHKRYQQQVFFFFSGYKPEDFIGRVAVLCQAPNNCNVEYIALHRFYLGCFQPDWQNCRVCFVFFFFFNVYLLSSSKKCFLVFSVLGMTSISCRQKSHCQLTFPVIPVMRLTPEMNHWPMCRSDVPKCAQRL